MLSMSVAGDDELECLDVDEDEPVSKSARNMEKSCENVSNKLGLLSTKMLVVLLLTEHSDLFYHLFRLCLLCVI